MAAEYSFSILEKNIPIKLLIIRFSNCLSRNNKPGNGTINEDRLSFFRHPEEDP